MEVEAKELHALFRKLDTDGSGGIDFKEPYFNMYSYVPLYSYVALSVVGRNRLHRATFLCLSLFLY